MGIKFHCPNGHKLNVKSFLAGKRGICPDCGVRFRIPLESGGIAEVAEKKSRSSEDQEAVAIGASALSSGESSQHAGTQAGAFPHNAFSQGTEAAGQTAPLPVASSGGQAESGGPNAFDGPVHPAAPSSAGPSPDAFAGQSADASAPQAAASAMPADPLAESPQAVWYVRPRSGGQYGPASADVLRSWIGEGRVAGDSLVWREGWPQWQLASEVLPQCRIGGGGLAFGGQEQSFADAGGAGGGLDLGIGTADPVSRSTGRVAPRRKSNGLTAAVVVLLAIIAIVLAIVFAFVIMRPTDSGSDVEENSGSGSYSSTRREPATLARVC